MKKTLFSLFFAFFALNCFSQITVTSSVDKTDAEVGDFITLTVRVDGAGAEMNEPQLPSMPSFNFYETDYSRQMFNSNISLVYVYRLIPRFSGPAEIGPVVYESRGTVFQSEPIKINVFRPGEMPKGPKPAQKVAQGYTKPAQTLPSDRPDVAQKVPSGYKQVLPAAPPPPPAPAPAATPKEDVFLRTSVDKRSVYVGEQLIFNVHFFNSVPVSIEQYFPPQPTHFTSEEMGEIPSEKVRLGAKNFNVTGLKTAFFGAVSGKAELGAAKVSFLVEKRGPLDFLFNSVERGVAESEPVAIEIKPLPDGKGAHFYNAVGSDMAYSADADRTSLPVGEAATITFTLRGKGNLRAVTQPAFDVPPAFRSYEMQGESNILPINGIIQGLKTFKLVLIGQQSGEAVLPSQKFTFFDVVSGSYKTLETEPIRFNILPAADGGGAAFNFGSGTTTSGVKNLARDIEYIKDVSLYKNSVFEPLSKTVWAAGALLAIMVLAKVFIKIKPQKTAIKTALSQIAAAKTPRGVGDALSTYIHKKTGIKPGGVKIKTITQNLTNKHHVPHAAAAKLEGLLTGLDALKFSPMKIKADADLTPLKKRAADILSVVDKAFK